MPAVYATWVNLPPTDGGTRFAHKISIGKSMDIFGSDFLGKRGFRCTKVLSIDIAALTGDKLTEVLFQYFRHLLYLKEARPYRLMGK